MDIFLLKIGSTCNRVQSIQDIATPSKELLQPRLVGSAFKKVLFHQRDPRMKVSIWH